MEGLTLPVHIQLHENGLVCGLSAALSFRVVS